MLANFYAQTTLAIATVCTVKASNFLPYARPVYASKLLPHAQYKLTKNKIIQELLPYEQCTLGICYHMHMLAIGSRMRSVR